MEQLAETKYMSIREYAEKWAITQPAVWQSIKAKKNAKHLEGHIIKDDSGRTLLDPEAVRILDEVRTAKAVIVDSPDSQKKIAAEFEARLAEKSAEIEELKAQVKALTEGNRLMAEAVKTITDEKKLLEDRRDEHTRTVALLEDRTEQLERAKDQIQQMSAENRELAEKSSEQLEKISGLEARTVDLEAHETMLSERIHAAEQTLKSLKTASFWERRRLIKELKKENA